MFFLYSVTFLALVISFLADRQKTVRALKTARKKFLKIFPDFLTMLILISIILYFIPDKLIGDILGNGGKLSGFIIAAVLGSVTFMPGFIAFPLCGILLQKGVSYMILSVFTTTMMMVGVLTFPLEKAYFGTKVTLLRNGLSLLIAIGVALMAGLFFGEL